ncbi:MAG TPA: cell wall hydrolase [Aliiroseovarius sp.]|nr:cell wall hydrolase [Aliiroseovarius sp.]
MKRNRIVMAVLGGLFAAGLSAQTAVAEPGPGPGATLNSVLGLEQSGLANISADQFTKLASISPSVTYSSAWLNAQPRASGNAEWQCLTQALYFEARGETVKGMFAVAEVIMNRVDSSQFPNSICAVINQGTGRKFRCQFTFTCDGLPETINEPAAYERVGKVARALIDGAARNLTDGATYYHTTAVKPSWARKFIRTAKIGVHLFYRKPVRVSSN